MKTCNAVVVSGPVGVSFQDRICDLLTEIYAEEIVGSVEAYDGEFRLLFETAVDYTDTTYHALLLLRGLVAFMECAVDSGIEFTRGGEDDEIMFSRCPTQEALVFNRNYLGYPEVSE